MDFRMEFYGTEIAEQHTEENLRRTYKQHSSQTLDKQMKVLFSQKVYNYIEIDH